MNPDLIDGVHDPRESVGVEQRQARPAGRSHRPAPRPRPHRLPPRVGQPRFDAHHAISIPISFPSRSCPTGSGTGRPPASSHYSHASTAHRSPGTGRCTAAGTRASGHSAAPACPGSFALPSGTRSSSATGPIGSVRWRRQTCAGRPGSSGPATLWHRWDYPYQVGSPQFDDRHEVIGRYLADNFRAFRTWGVSAISPWEYGHFWRLRDGVARRRKDLPVDWENLQRPGFSPDYHRSPVRAM